VAGPGLLGSSRSEADLLIEFMSDVIQELYETRVYPAMSHPLSDPAVCAVAAVLGGLSPRHPAGARILEIGCCSGMNLIPLAMRWPGSRFDGLDLSVSSIHEAVKLAAAAEVRNVDFQAVDLRDFAVPDDRKYDYIIAHGFFSWVPDEVKSGLLAFCRKHLAPDGIANISFNLECGWQPRFPVIQKTRAILQAGAADEMAALTILRSITDPISPEIAIIDDMLAKGPDILAFDDFGPVNDPWPMDRFVRTAAAAGLRWLGESDPSQNLPSGLDDATLDRLRCETSDAISFQIAADIVAGRTFRSGILCRDDAPVAEQVTLRRVMDFSFRAGFRPALAEEQKIQELARLAFDGIYQGWLLPRIEPVVFDPEVPEFPKLNGFRLECARRYMPLVDIWHRPCSFPANHYRLLAQMDGKHDLAHLGEVSRKQCPELDFGPWLRHLAGRGMFANA
jgi:2-polyprenyl-3-methyl-5-hydroxy-6-metoxy-1,4-benzoquinol methylase